MLRLLRLVPALALVLLALSALSVPRQADAGKTHVTPSHRVLLKQIRRYQKQTWRWQALMGVRRTPTTHAAVRDPSRRFKLWLRNLWHRRALRAWKQALRPPHRAGWSCIQRYEASWVDSDPPYYGGLQMDLSFQSRYGGELLRRKGTADRWTPLEQMWVAERAHRSGRGFYPWPNAARLCGLI